MYTVTLVLSLILALGNVAAKSRAEWEKRVKEINDKSKNNLPWKAALAKNIPYEDDAALRVLASAKIDYSDLGDNGNGNGHNQEHSRLLQTVSLPTELNLVTKYPDCWSIRNIRDQGQCGSCWAVSSMSALSDRYCIAFSNSTTIVQKSFSYQDALECCTVCGFSSQGGCNGGFVSGAYKFAKSTGIVGGENYQNTTQCKPYFLDPNSWDYSVYVVTAPACALNCSTIPTADSSSKYTADKIKLLNYYVYSNTTYSSATMIKTMKTALYKNGTIIASMKVYDCFYAYSEGVYVKSSDLYYGSHAIRLIGWGVTSAGLSYWIGANSWGTYWGQSGFFWIRMGVNEVGIESYVVEGNFK